MTRILPLLTLALILAACNAPEPPRPTGESVAGRVIGSTYEDTPLTIGKGGLEGKALVITYFATW